MIDPQALECNDEGQSFVPDYLPPVYDHEDDAEMSYLEALMVQ